MSIKYEVCYDCEQSNLFIQEINGKLSLAKEGKGTKGQGWQSRSRETICKWSATQDFTSLLLWKKFSAEYAKLLTPMTTFSKNYTRRGILTKSCRIPRLPLLEPSYILRHSRYSPLLGNQHSVDDTIQNYSSLFFMNWNEALQANPINCNFEIFLL